MSVMQIEKFVQHVMSVCIYELSVRGAAEGTCLLLMMIVAVF
jgi:hypothetical protein